MSEPITTNDLPATQVSKPDLSPKINGSGQTPIAVIFKQAFLMFILLTVLTGCIYPAIVTIFAQSIFPHQANGSLIKQDDKTIGSELLGQEFSSPGYFWGRISATTPAYNAAASSGSNLGPTNPALLKQVKDRIAVLKAADPDNKSAIPIDLVSSSGSGLDPDISLEAANYQANRVARDRGISRADIDKLISSALTPRQLGILGDPRVNVLKLNLSLDHPQPTK